MPRLPTRGLGEAAGTTLLLARWFPPRVGGVETYLRLIYAELASLTAVLVLAPEEPGAATYDRSHALPRIIRARAGPSNSKSIAPRMVPAAMRAVAREQVTQIHCGHLLLGLLGLLGQQLLGVPYLVFAYGTEVRRGRLRGWRRLIFTRADHVVSISSFTSEALGALGVRQDRITLIPPVVDCNAFRPNGTAREVFRRNHGIALSAPTILTVCRLSRNAHHKGVDDLIAAVAELVDEYPDLVLLIVGNGDDRSRLERCARDAGLGSHAIFVGRLSEEDLPGAYAAADIFALANKQQFSGERTVEGFGIVLIEASASGLPVVATSAGGAVDAVAQDYTGLLVPPDDPTGMARGLRRLLCDSVLRARFGRAGRERALRQFAPEAAALQLQSEVITQLTRRRRRWRWLAVAANRMSQ